MDRGTFETLWKKSWCITIGLGRLSVTMCAISPPESAERPQFMWEVVDVRKLFKTVMEKSGNLSDMLTDIGMEFEGREHCGLDDARNIARIVLYLATEKNARLEPNTNFKKNKAKKGAWCKMRKEVTVSAVFQKSSLEDDKLETD